MIAGVLIYIKIFTEFTKYIVSDISPLLRGSLFFEVFFFLGDGDIERGVVLGGSVGVVSGSLVQDLASWGWWLNHGHRGGHRWR